MSQGGEKMTGEKRQNQFYTVVVPYTYTENNQIHLKEEQHKTLLNRKNVAFDVGFLNINKNCLLNGCLQCISFYILESNVPKPSS